MDLEVLTTATLSKLEEIKEKTATGQWFLSFCSQLLPVDKKATVPLQSWAPVPEVWKLEGPA